jgi:hypothetical protein
MLRNNTVALRAKVVGGGEDTELLRAISQNQRRIFLLVAPAVLALCAAKYEQVLTLWFKGRDSTLLVGLFLLFSAVLHPRLHRLLIVTLCYGVAFLAFRDAFWVLDYPEPVSAPLSAALRFVALSFVFALALGAAFMECLRPNTLKARRFSMGAAALYFCDQGVLNLVLHFSWQSLIFLTAGIISGVACLFAAQIIITDEENSSAFDVEERARVQAQERRLLSRSKEWSDHTETQEADPNLTMNRANP